PEVEFDDFEESYHDDYAAGYVDEDDAVDERFAPEVDSGMVERGAPPRRRYRPGRGGFDPEAAALAARAKYAFRQRIVLFLLLTVVVTAVLGGFVWSMMWWLNGIVDLALVGY